MVVSPVKFVDEPAPIRQGQILQAGPFSDFIGGAFGYVEKHFIKIASVSVKLMNGLLLHHVGVPSFAWGGAGTGKGKVDLPPIGSFVFVLFPYGIKNTSGAFVLFTTLDPKVDKGLLVEGEEKKVVSILDGNMKTTYDRETGNYTVEDVDDEKFKLQIDKANKKLIVSDWSENKITTDSNGMKLEAKGNTVSLESGKALINNHLEVSQ